MAFSQSLQPPSLVRLHKSSTPVRFSSLPSSYTKRSLIPKPELSTTETWLSVLPFLSLPEGAIDEEKLHSFNIPQYMPQCWWSTLGRPRDATGQVELRVEGAELIAVRRRLDHLTEFAEALRCCFDWLQPNLRRRRRRRLAIAGGCRRHLPTVFKGIRSAAGRGNWWWNEGGFGQREGELWKCHQLHTAKSGDELAGGGCSSRCRHGDRSGYGYCNRDSRLCSDEKQLEDVITAMDQSRKTLQQIRVTYVFAMAYNVVAIPVAAGLLFPSLKIRLPPWVAGDCMALSSVSVVCSSLLLSRYRKPRLTTLLEISVED
ncbi:hypothetical protein SASPL_100582 [Salvia splendens]|uniref:Cu+-exporting ATPase n=1 Tax=Salvia splendens TaxID=180675 RepID=A0A8X9AAF1_SALSN|nr:hypothetical protein SASPL_100582 [Salvia splendens]